MPKIDNRKKYHICPAHSMRLVDTVVGVKAAREACSMGNRKYFRADYCRVENGMVTYDPPVVPPLTAAEIALLKSAIEDCNAWKGSKHPDDFEAHDAEIAAMRAVLNKVSKFTRVGEIVIAPKDLLGGGFSVVQWDRSAPPLPVGTVFYILQE